MEPEGGPSSIRANRAIRRGSGPRLKPWTCLEWISGARKAMKVIDEWFQETKRVDPCVNWFPEELALSVVAWRNKAEPLMHWGLFVCTNENKDHIDSFPFWNFLLDLNR